MYCGGVLKKSLKEITKGIIRRTPAGVFSRIPEKYVWTEVLSKYIILMSEETTKDISECIELTNFQNQWI